MAELVTRNVEPKEMLPVSIAIHRNSELLTLLIDNIDTLRTRTASIRYSYPSPSSDDNSASAGASDVTQALRDLGDRIETAIQVVKSILTELEI